MDNIKKQLKENGVVDLIAYTQEQFNLSEKNYLRVLTRGEEEFTKGLLDLGVYEIRDGFLIKLDLPSPKREKQSKPNTSDSVITNSTTQKEITKLNKTIQSQLEKINEKDRDIKIKDDKIKKLSKSEKKTTNDNGEELLYTQKQYSEIWNEKHKLNLESITLAENISFLENDKKKLQQSLRVLKAKREDLPKTKEQLEQEEIHNQQDKGRLDAL